MRTTVTDRLAGAVGAAAVLSLIGIALLLGLGVGRQPSLWPAPAPILIEAAPAKQRPLARPARGSTHPGRPSPPNVENQATPVEAPKTSATVPMITVATKPDVAAAANSGAAARIGPGDGAGGQGDGSGGGGAYDGGGETSPRQIAGQLDFADIPRALRDAGVGGTVQVRYNVEVDGRANICSVDASSGNDALDRLTCSLIERRFRFIPARDRDGTAVRSTIVQRQIWINDSGRTRRDGPESR